MASVALFTQYIGGLPPLTLNRVYEDPWVCQAVYRSLPTVAKVYGMRMLFAGDEGVPLATVNEWPTPDGLAVHEDALGRLERLRILTHWQGVLVMNSNFRSQLKASLHGSLEQPWIPAEASNATREVVVHLENFAETQWQKVLLLLEDKLDEDDQSYTPSDVLIETLIAAGLRTDEGDMTDEGFKFLLQNVYSQLWTVLVHYVDAASHMSGFEEMEQHTVISFLLRLSFASVGTPYLMSGLDAGQRALLPALQELGLIFIMNKEFFFPTRLAVRLMTGGGENSTDEDRDKYIIVETNFRLYAYTKLTVKVGLIELFAHVQVRLPDMTMAIISRQSVRDAFKKGITAREIIAYLRDHAHPEMARQNNPIIPETVTDQIRLWEAERNRISCRNAVLYDSFASVDEYVLAVRYAKDIKVFLQCLDGKQTLIVKQEGHEAMKEYLISLKPKPAAPPSVVVKQEPMYP